MDTFVRDVGDDSDLDELMARVRATTAATVEQGRAAISTEAKETSAFPPVQIEYVKLRSHVATWLTRLESVSFVSPDPSQLNQGKLVSEISSFTRLK